VLHASQRIERFAWALLYLATALSILPLAIVLAGWIY
jgi:hypothetical protein